MEEKNIRFFLDESRHRACLTVAAANLKPLINNSRKKRGLKVGWAENL
ncbi:hypothetical protein AB7942_21025 [Neobacillus sp. BF23-41]